MKPDDKIVLFLTFLTGMFAGATLYILVFAPEYEADPVAVKSAFSVVGEMYGGCERSPSGCPSFRLEDNRSYQYLVGAERTEGKLPGAVYNSITELMSAYRLSSHAAPLERDDCASYVDAIDFRYEITYESVRYVLDTCETSLSYGSELQQGFLDAWEYMASPTAAYPTIIEGGVSGWLIERFRGE